MYNLIAECAPDLGILLEILTNKNNVHRASCRKLETVLRGRTRTRLQLMRTTKLLQGRLPVPVLHDHRSKWTQKGGELEVLRTRGSSYLKLCRRDLLTSFNYSILTSPWPRVVSVFPFYVIRRVMIPSCPTTCGDYPKKIYLDLTNS